MCLVRGGNRFASSFSLPHFCLPWLKKGDGFLMDWFEPGTWWSHAFLIRRASRPSKEATVVRPPCTCFPHTEEPWCLTLASRSTSHSPNQLWSDFSLARLWMPSQSLIKRNFDSYLAFLPWSETLTVAFLWVGHNTILTVQRSHSESRAPGTVTGSMETWPHVSSIFLREEGTIIFNFQKTTPGLERLQPLSQN